MSNFDPLLDQNLSIQENVVLKIVLSGFKQQFWKGMRNLFG